MISSVTSTSQAAATSAAVTSSTSGPADVTTENTPFGELFVENLDTANPTIVGYQAPGSQTMAAGYADSAAAASAVSTSATSATTASTSTSSSPSLIPGIASNDMTAVPTVESVFGSSPWISDAGGNGPTGAFNLNPMYFATQQTAETVAAMVGGTVVPVDTFAQTPGNHFTQNEPNEMVQLPGGAMINPGLVAGFFTHGYQASMVQQMIQNEVTNVESETKGVSTT